MKGIGCQAGEFALYLVINREPLNDFNPGSDMITAGFRKIPSMWRGLRLEGGERLEPGDQLRVSESQFG